MLGRAATDTASIGTPSLVSDTASLLNACHVHRSGFVTCTTPRASLSARRRIAADRARRPVHRPDQPGVETHDLPGDGREAERLDRRRQLLRPRHRRACGRRLDQIRIEQPHPQARASLLGLAVPSGARRAGWLEPPCGPFLPADRLGHSRCERWPPEGPSHRRPHPRGLVPPRGAGAAASGPWTSGSIRSRRPRIGRLRSSGADGSTPSAARR